VLELRSLGKQYPDGTVALEDFSLRIEDGVLGLLGPNGAGKTTLMSILATVTKPTSGTFLWKGRDGVSEPSALRAVLGYLPQDFGVYEKLTAREFLSYLGRLKGLSALDLRRRVGAVLELVNLHGVADRRLGGFSGGMRQRAGIAQALLGARSSSSSTSRRWASTPRSESASGTCSPRSPTVASSSSPPTSSRTWRRWLRGSRSCAGGAS